MDDISQKIRLLRQELLAIRQRTIQDLDAFDQRLAALESEPEGSFQIPQDWEAAMMRDVAKFRKIGAKTRNRYR